MTVRVTPWALALAASALAFGPAMAQQGKLPSTLTFTAYDTGSSGFNIAVAVGKMFKEKHGTDLRVLPAGNDVARFAPLRGNRAQIAAGGIGAYFAQEGVLEFGVREWGPQQIRVLLSVVDCNGLSVGVAKDSGVKQIKDFKGKRLGVVVGAPALNQGAFAFLAYAGLTPNDVKIVEFSGYGAMWKGVLNNEIDGAFASSISGQAKEVESSPRGIIWPPAPASDTEGWKRLNKIAPYFYPHNATCGAGFAKDETVQMPAYPYPIFSTYSTTPADLVQNITRAMIVNYNDYKDGAPGATGLDIKRQKLQWVIPYHEGAVAALKEAGVWSAADDAHNKALIARQEVLTSAWTAFMKTSPPEDKDAFSKGWMKARKEALDKAGMDPVYGE